MSTILIQKKMLRNELFRAFLTKSNKPSRFLFNLRHKSTALDVEKLEKEASNDISGKSCYAPLKTLLILLVFKVIDEELKTREEELERKRNKSRLRPQDRNFLFEKNPYPEPKFWSHGTLKYLRRTYGRYGEASGVNPAICWPVKSELEEAKEYERIAYPYGILEVAEDARKKREEKNEKMRIRQEEIVKKMAKLEQMKEDLHKKIQSKENEAKAAKVLSFI